MGCSLSCFILRYGHYLEYIPSDGRMVDKCLIGNDLKGNYCDLLEESFRYLSGQRLGPKAS
jgi:hypothetical protein